jgi:hypothetical protein
MPATKTAAEIATERSRYIALADSFRRAGKPIPSDIRDGLRFVAIQERRWMLENPGCA